MVYKIGGGTEGTLCVTSKLSDLGLVVVLNYLIPCFTQFEGWTRLDRTSLTIEFSLQ